MTLLLALFHQWSKFNLRSEIENYRIKILTQFLARIRHHICEFPNKSYQETLFRKILRNISRNILFRHVKIYQEDLV